MGDDYTNDFEIKKMIISLAKAGRDEAQISCSAIISIKQVTD